MRYQSMTLRGLLHCHLDVKAALIGRGEVATWRLGQTGEDVLDDLVEHCRVLES